MAQRVTGTTAGGGSAAPDDAAALVMRAIMVREHRKALAERRAARAAAAAERRARLSTSSWDTRPSPKADTSTGGKRASIVIEDEYASARQQALWASRHPEKVRQERALAERRAARDRHFDNKREGTAATHLAAMLAQAGRSTIAKLAGRGVIDDVQQAYAEDIEAAARLVTADVAVRTASLETRVDISSRNAGDIEPVGRVRLERAYTLWRARRGGAAGAIIDIIMDEVQPRGLAAVAGRHRMRRTTLRSLLIEALNDWPECRRAAFFEVKSAA